VTAEAQSPLRPKVPTSRLLPSAPVAAISRLILRIGGWTLKGKRPDVAKYVLLAAPHTTNWDGIWLLPAASALGIELCFIGKRSLFVGPLGWLLRAIGGIPIDRGKRQSTVSQCASWFRNADRLVLGIAPEGTRSWTPGWKTGFYYIALEAKVPIALGFIDYGKRECGVRDELLHPTGDIGRDFEFLRKWYGPCIAGRPENKSPIEPIT
jgi:1-acyl-sn-glycerol-3-phosphate acyltransferase